MTIFMLPNLLQNFGYLPSNKKLSCAAADLSGCKKKKQKFWKILSIFV